jgi:hypothetical protein
MRGRDMMYNSTVKRKMGLFKSNDRAVSEIVGSAILLGIVLSGTIIFLLLGTNVINGAKSSATLNGVEQAFTMADSRLSKARFSTAIFQDAPFKVTDGVVNVNASWDDSHIIISDYDNIAMTSTVLYNQTLGTIKCILDDGIVAYQAGGVWMLDNSGGSIMLSPPDFDYNGVTLTLPVMYIKGNASMFASNGATVIISAKSSDPINIYPSASYGNPVPAQHFITITIKSDYYLAWADYINERTSATAVTDANTKTVTVTLSSGVGRQGGSVDDGFSTKSMDTTINDPIISFYLNVYTKNNGNDYEVNFGQPSSYPQLHIYIGRTTGGINQEKDMVVVKYETANNEKEEWRTLIEFHRKMDNSIDANLLNHTAWMDYTSDSLPNSKSWGNLQNIYDTGTTSIPEYDEPSHPDVIYDENDVPQKTMHDIIQHYMLLMAKYDQASGNDRGPQYNEDYEGKKVETTTKFYLEYTSDQDIKYLYITEGILDISLSSSG